MRHDGDSVERAMLVGLTREELLRRGLGGAVLLSSGGLLAACGGGDDDDAAVGTTAASGEAKKGGTIRAGVTGGGAKDTIDAHKPVTKPDQARVVQLHEPLARYNEKFEVEDNLAEEISADDPKVWTIRLREGVEFHNGKTVTADDVIFSLRRILNPKTASFGGAGLAAIDPNGLRKMDERTVRLTLKQADVTIRDELGQYFNGIVPVGYDGQKPVGTGPFKFVSFTPGQESRFTRNENYWRDGEPLVDEVVIINFADPTARVNALLGGQVDAIDEVPFGQVPVIERDDRFKILESEQGGWRPFTMRIDAEPFKDVRVRQAFRLIADRQQLIDQALDGHGRLANDLYAPFDPCYADDLPQRDQDLDEAKSLLQQAGKANLRIDLTTADIAAGVVEAAQVFAEQARGAGVRVNVKKIDTGEFYGDNYLKWVFAQDFWGTRNYLQQAAAGSLPGSPFNETHWADPNPAKYRQLIAQARTELDEDKRCEILHEAQELEYNEGGHIIWGFISQVDAHATKLTGLVPDRGTLPLNHYGFRHAGFSE